MKTKQITSKQIRKQLGKHYDGSYDAIARFEDEEFGKALVASAEFRAIAEELEKTGYQVEQVRQVRDVLDPMVSCLSRQIGDFYLKTQEPLKVEELAKVKGLETYTLKVHERRLLPISNTYSKRYIFGSQENVWDRSAPAVCFYENEQPPVDGIRKILKTLVDRIISPTVIGGDISVRIA